MKDHQHLHPGEKVLEIARNTKQDILHNVPLGTDDVGSIEVLSDHGDTTEDDGVVGESAETMPPLATRFLVEGDRDSKTRKDVLLGSFGTPAMETAETKSLHSVIVGTGGMNSLTFFSRRISGHRRYRNQYRVRMVAPQSVSLFWCFCQKLGCPVQRLQRKECRPDEVQIEVTPREEWLLDEVDLNTVTISNMSLDSKSVETDGKRVRYREITVDSGAGESVSI